MSQKINIIPTLKGWLFSHGASLKSDIQGALNFGYRSALVLTGVTTVEMAENSVVQPDMIFQTLG